MVIQEEQEGGSLSRIKPSKNDCQGVRENFPYKCKILFDKRAQDQDEDNQLFQLPLN